jgi:RNA polymerase sigma factor for flagellar operon FliA
LYYEEELTMKEISKIVGIVVSRVSQIHAAAMVKLRAPLGALRESPASHPGEQHRSSQTSAA